MDAPPRIIRVAQFGLGPIGLESLRLLARTPWARVVGGVDIDPAKHGQSIDTLTQVPELKDAKVYASLDELMGQATPDVVLHTAGSSVKDTINQISQMVEAGVSVATTCEPMLYPWLTAPHEAMMLDSLAETRRVSVVGTGVNPGFVMDLLPVVVSGVLRHVDRVLVQRVVNASTRRMPLQRKVGSGMDPDRFLELYRQGKAGHAGFRESVALIADAMGWTTDAHAITQDLEPVIATRRIQTPYFTVEAGQTRGLHQVATLRHEDREAVRLDLTMALDEPSPRDRIEIEGDHHLVANIEGGVPGDTATVAAMVNVVPRLLDASPGLRKTTELGAPRHQPRRVAVLSTRY